MIGKNAGVENSKKLGEIKSALCNPEILVSPTGGRYTKVMANASSSEVGVVILQQEDAYGWRPVAFTSRQFKASEMAYPVYQKECLAVEHALTKWEKYLYRNGFTVVTDQLFFKSLMNLKEPKGRLARWLM